MGRKIDMKKIDDVTKCQVTFSKRRSSLMKKANEVSVCCDVDVAFIAFSPSGRISKFCNKKRIEDVLHRYVNLPPGSRLNHVSNVQSKMEKLRHLDHIKGEKNKLQFMDKQIENLELQIKKSGLELQILEADLRDYEVDGEQEPSLHHLSWCERNINNSFEKVIARKNALLFGDLSSSPMQMNQDGVSFPPTFIEHDNPSGEHVMTQLDQWMNPFSSRVHPNIFQDLLDHSTYAPNFSIPSNICNFPNIPDSPIVYGSRPMVTSDSQIPAPPPPKQPFVLDQTLLDFPSQNNVNAWNSSYEVNFSNTNHNPTKSLYISQPPRLTSTTMPTTDAPQHDHNVVASFQFANSNLSQFTNIEEGEIGQLDLDHGTNLDSNKGNDNKLQTSDQQESIYRVHPPKEIDQDITFDNPRPEDTLGENAVWKSNVEKSNLWEWEDLLLDENLNLANIPIKNNY